MAIDLNRKGARSLKDLSNEVLEALNKGELESVNLTEWLAVDHVVLIQNVLYDPYKAECLAILRESGVDSAMQSIKIVGRGLSDLATQYSDGTLLESLKNHISDSVRCWATYMLGSDSRLSIFEKLEEMKFFAKDSHFGVREIAWMAIRDELSEHLDTILPVLAIWSKDENEYIRRFATESVRPKGVWCKQIDELKQSPERMSFILENLKSDNSRYVQDSVANWLNDASKSRPDFVVDLCNRWAKDSPSKATQYIVKRALRTINKK